MHTEYASSTVKEGYLLMMGVGGNEISMCLLIGVESEFLGNISDMTIINTE